MSNSIILFLIIGTLVGILAYIFYYNRKATKEASGWTASRYCPTVVYGDWRGGVRSGDGQLDGDVNIVFCPRSPYCSNDPSTNGKFKIMWWWDGLKMQDSTIIKPN